MTRRELLALAAAASLGRTWKESAAPRLALSRVRRRVASAPAIRLGRVRSDFDPDGYRNGADMGLDELRRTADLVGMTLDLVEGTPSDPPSDVFATVAFGRDAAIAPMLEHAVRTRTPLLVTSSSGPGSGALPCSPYLLRTGVPGTEAARVLGAWREQRDSPASAGDADVAAWHPSLFKYGAEQLNERYRRAFDAGMAGDAWCAWVAMKIAGEAALRAVPRGVTGSSRLGGASEDMPRRSDGTSLDTLVGSGARFDGHKGVPLAFRASDGWLRQPLYVVSSGAGGGGVLAEIGAAAEARPGCVPA